MRYLAALFGAALSCVAVPALAQSSACGGDFAAWKSDVANEARAAGVGERGLGALEAATIDQKVLNADRAQGVFNQTFVQFSDRMISQYRLTNGKANLQKYANYFDRAEKEFGVPGPIVAAFWALETDFGAVQGNFDSLNALVTLSHDCRRPELFRKQIVPLLTLIDQGTLPAGVKGAWAGEIGQTQILPSDYLSKGIDADGDGMVDLRNDIPDVILTTANKIKSRGWKAGEPWMMEVTVPDQMPWDQTGRTNRLPISQWSQWGVKTHDGAALPAELPDAGLALPMGHKGPAFLVFENFDVYLQWNQSIVYALTAANLATRLDGAPKLDPRNADEGLGPDAMKQLQTKLEARGYDVGGIDGILGMNTREAVRQEQIRLGLVVDGWPTPDLLSKL